MKIGYFLSSEESSPHSLVEQAVKAAEAGFDELYVSQIGPDRDAFFSAYRERVLPQMQ